MLMMRRLKATVGQGGTVIVQDRVDYPEGTELKLGLYEQDEVQPGEVDELDDEDELELDPEQRAARDAAIEEAWRSYKAGGPTYSSEEMWARLRAQR